MRTMTAGVLLLVLAVPTMAADWEPVTVELLKKEKPGYGGLCGVLVDHSTGAVLVDVSDRGLFRSDDGGKTWTAFATPFKGRTEWPGCLLLDPTGKSQKLLAALVYGSPVLTGTLKGDSWSVMNNKSGHVDWCSVDWTDSAAKFVLALKHESGGMLIASHDGGKTFADVGKGYAAAWVFDDKTAVAAQMKAKEMPKPGLVRTTDGGKTWQPCGDYSATALPKWFDGKLYWLVNGALLATTDKGATWKKISDVKDGRYGPIFGKTANHLFVLAQAGILESTDAGVTWSKPVPVPKELKGVSALTWLEYDPVHDALYVMKMTSELFKMARK